MAQHQGPKEAFPVKQQIQLSVFIVSSFLDLRIAFFIFGFAIIAVQLVGEALLVFPVQPDKYEDKEDGRYNDSQKPGKAHIIEFPQNYKFDQFVPAKSCNETPGPIIKKNSATGFILLTWKSLRLL